METRYCKICNSPFTPTKHNNYICPSPACKRESRLRKNKKTNEVYHRACTECGKEFDTTYTSKVTCSKGCSTKRKIRQDSERNKRVKAEKRKLKNKPRANKSLSEFNLMAREMGLSYGQLQQLKTIKMMGEHKNAKC